MSNQNPVVDCDRKGIWKCRHCRNIISCGIRSVEIVPTCCQNPFCYKRHSEHYFSYYFNHCQRSFSLFDLLINTIDLSDTSDLEFDTEPQPTTKKQRTG